MKTQQLCVTCKGRGYCGKSCPFLTRLVSYRRTFSSGFSGTSPPSVFVGRADYPHVSAGILSPPEERGDAWQLDAPDFWFQKGMGVADIIDMRVSLVNSRFTVNVKKPDKTYDAFRELALSEKIVDVEIKVKGTIRSHVSFDHYLTPMGPSIELTDAKVTDNVSVPKKVDSLVGDGEVKATDALSILHDSGISSYHLQRLLSAGMLGLKGRRKMVPTRWAITAVHDTLAKRMMPKVMESPQIGEYEVFHSKYLDNDYHVVLLPRIFSFEQIEAYVPGAVWQKGPEPVVISDYESHMGRKKYADRVAGAYYAAKLAIAEHLAKRGRQGAALVVRTIGPGYFCPLGVWQVFENIKSAMASAPVKFANLEEALGHIGNEGRLSKGQIKKESRLLSEARTQKSLLEF